jgi:ribose transport system ATP-binding protein
LRKPMAAIRAGIATVPEERKSAGLVLSMSVLDNMTLPRVGAYSERVTGLLYDRERKQQALSLLQTMRVRYSRLGQPISHLSGGNQQKIVLARWLMSHRPKLLILDEPTRGIDVGAKAELYKLIVELADQGAGILLASSDMNELLNLSHRVLVFRQGEIVGELDREELEQEAILRLAMGVSVN